MCDSHCLQDGEWRVAIVVETSANGMAHIHTLDVFVTRLAFEIQFAQDLEALIVSVALLVPFDIAIAVRPQSKQ